MSFLPTNIIKKIRPNPEAIIAEVVARRCFIKNMLKNCTKCTGKHLCLFKKVTDLEPGTALKVTPTQVFFCEFGECFLEYICYKTPPSG